MEIIDLKVRICFVSGLIFSIQQLSMRHQGWTLKNTELSTTDYSCYYYLFYGLYATPVMNGRPWFKNKI